MSHLPVLKKEVLEYLNPNPNESFIDCTIDGGGHTFDILKMSAPKGKVLGIDWDEEIIQSLKSKIKDLKIKNRLILVSDNFVNLKKIIKKEEFRDISGILFDLGMSSWHLEKSRRGFSFLRDEPLDMRYNPKTQGIRAVDILNHIREREIEKILRDYGEERFARSIAKEIRKARGLEPILTSFELVEIIKRGVPKWYQRGRIHFATKTFQALRIAVNQELDNLKEALPMALEILNPGGRLVVISFHSLEDRIVKNFLKDKHQKGLLKILTKKPLTPQPEEVRANPRSRSAKLRAATKI